MANLPIFIAVLIVAAVVVRVYFSIKRNEKPPIARVFWCATLLIPLGVVAAWITNQSLVNEGSSYGSFLIRRSVLPPSCFLSSPWFRDLSTKPTLRRERLPVFAATSLSSPLFQRSRSFQSKLPATKRSIAFPPTHSGFPSGCSRRFCFLYLLGQRHGGVMVLVPVVCCVLGIAEHFVITFKGEAILPSDILALGTAMEVSEGYEFTFTAGIVTSLALLEISLGLLSLIRPRKLRTPTHVFPAIAANLCAFLLVTVVGLSGFSNIDLEQALDFGFDRWQPITTYASQGFITSFTEMVNELPIEKPEDYTPDEAQSIEQELAAVYDSTYGSSEQRGGRCPVQ